MMIDMHPRFLTAALCLLLGGCASLETTQSPGEPDIPTVANTLGETAEGGVVEVESTDFGVDRVSIGTRYTAASGKICKRLFNAAQQELPRVVCQSANGEWYLQRSLGLAKSNSLSQVTNNVVTRPETIVNRSVSYDNEIDGDTDEGDTDFVERQVQSGETLWSFAQRLTGNGFNWHQIAEANNIDDARLLDDNATLQIPTGLLKAGQ